MRSVLHSITHQNHLCVQIDSDSENRAIRMRLCMSNTSPPPARACVCVCVESTSVLTGMWQPLEIRTLLVFRNRRKIKGGMSNAQRSLRLCAHQRRFIELMHTSLVRPIRCKIGPPRLTGLSEALLIGPTIFATIFDRSVARRFF